MFLKKKYITLSVVTLYISLPSWQWLTNTNTDAFYSDVTYSVTTDTATLLAMAALFPHHFYILVLQVMMQIEQ